MDTTSYPVTATVVPVRLACFHIGICKSNSSVYDLLFATQNNSSDSNEQVKIVAVGSTALQPLVDAAQESFVQENPNYQISVQGGGSFQSRWIRKTKEIIHNIGCCFK